MENNMNNPKILYRTTDGERFILNEDGTYSNERMVLDFPDNLHQSWSYETLMETGVFDVIMPVAIDFVV